MYWHVYSLLALREKSWTEKLFTGSPVHFTVPISPVSGTSPAHAAQAGVRLPPTLEADKPDQHPKASTYIGKERSVETKPRDYRGLKVANFLSHYIST